jgi:hypothetical protein
MTTRINGLLAMVCGAIAVSASLSAAPQQPSIAVKGNDVTIRGCVAKAPIADFGDESVLIWSRSDVILRSAAIQSGVASPLPDRVFYWLTDERDLAKHIGQRVEIKGELGDFKTGEVTMDRDGQFTDIKMKLGDKTEKARVPTVWLGGKEGKVTFPSRKIDVENVKVVGDC